MRARTEGPGDLRNPLTPTRAASLSDDPLSLLVRLFFCREPLPQTDLLPHDLLEAGILLETGDGHICAPFHLRIARDLYLFSDYLGADPEAVMGAGETTAILYQAARPSEPVGSVLDLGCGAGTLALLLARDAGHATGTDVNPRAITLAAFNAAVNGIENVDFRVGDLYAPVERERFDLIVSQPPYYPIGLGAEPGQAHTFLHGGERGDELPSRVLDGLPAHLTAQGRGVVFTSWPPEHKQPESPGLRFLELSTNRGELHGMRQCLDIVEAAPSAGWSAKREVPADVWGHVQWASIDQIFAAENRLRAPDSELLIAQLHLPAGATLFEEGTDLFLRCPAPSMVGFVSIDPETWRVISAVDRGQPPHPADLPIVRDAVRRGLLS